MFYYDRFFAPATLHTTHLWSEREYRLSHLAEVVPRCQRGHMVATLFGEQGRGERLPPNDEQRATDMRREAAPDHSPCTYKGKQNSSSPSNVRVCRVSRANSSWAWKINALIAF